ncbi:MAG: hypothetical protein ACP5GI_02735 [Sulfolobales archaeon]
MFQEKTEKTFYYLVKLPLEELKKLLSELNNQSLDIPKSKIIGIAKSTKDNSWIINIKPGLFGSTRVIMRREIVGDSIIFRSQDGELTFIFNLYKLDNENTLVEYRIKALEKMSILFSSELSLMNQRFVESLKAHYINVEIKQVDYERYRELLEIISRSYIAKNTISSTHEKHEIEKTMASAKPTTLAEKEILKETSISRIIEMIPIVGSREEKGVLTEISFEKSLDLKCSNCLLYDENTGYCILLMKKVEDPAKPMCRGESFIKRS